MDGTIYLYICSNCPTSLQKDFNGFIDRFKAEKNSVVLSASTAKATQHKYS